MSVTQYSCMFSNASAIVHSACSMLAFHNFPAAPPLKTTREKLSAHTEGNHTCSQPAASKLELNRIKSTAVPSSHRFSPPADQCLEVELRLVSTRGQAWSAPLCPRTGHPRLPWCPRRRCCSSPGTGWSTPLCPTSAPLCLPWPLMDRCYWSPGVNAAINFRSDPIRLSSAGWRLWPEQLAVAHHAREHDRAMHAAR